MGYYDKLIMDWLLMRTPDNRLVSTIKRNIDEI